MKHITYLCLLLCVACTLHGAHKQPVYYQPPVITGVHVTPDEDERPGLCVDTCECWTDELCFIGVYADDWPEHCAICECREDGCVGYVTQGGSVEDAVVPPVELPPYFP